MMGGDEPHVRLTLLDPFTSRGVWGSTYGQDNFGLDVDFAEQFLNTDDPVPITNDPLPLCSCVDVTGAVERDYALTVGLWFISLDLDTTRRYQFRIMRFD